MDILSISKVKGGQGATSICAALAASLARRGKRVLAVDLDSNGNLSAHFGIHDPEAGSRFLEVLTDGATIEEIIQDTKVQGVAIVPNSGGSAALDRILSQEPGGETILREKVEGLSRKKWDVVLIDTPPSLGLASISALVAARRVLVPVEARAGSLGSIARILEALETVKRRLNKGLTLAGIVVNRIDGRNRHSREVAEWIQEEYGKAVLPIRIRETIRVSEAFSHGEPVTIHNPNSTASRDLEALAQHLWRK